MSPERPARLLLVEDHQMVREGLRALLDAEEDFEVVGEASSAEEALSAFAALSPDVMVVDITLKGLDGVELMRRIREASPEAKLVVLTMHDDPATVGRALRAGASGYVLKGSGVVGLSEAIRQVMRGQKYLSAEVAHYAAAGLRDDGGPDALTDREREVLALICEGFTGREIAERLGLRPKTVENHRAHIMEKLGIHTTAGLVRYALSQQR